MAKEVNSFYRTFLTKNNEETFLSTHIIITTVIKEASSAEGESDFLIFFVFVRCS